MPSGRRTKDHCARRPADLRDPAGRPGRAPGVITQVLRHAEISVKMKIYSQALADATRDAPKRLGRACDERPY